jgi:hypothetical protein
MAKLISNKWWLFAGFIVIAALSRLLPHPYNFTPIGGMALFAGGLLSGKRLFWLIPLVAYYISDLLVNNILYASYYDSFIWSGHLFVYISLFAIIILGKFLLKKLSIGRLVIGSLSASTIFFLLSNFGVWLSSTTYPMSWEGLIACYAAAIPFFQNTLAGDAFYVLILFGSYAFITSKYPSLLLDDKKLELSQ